MIRLVCPVADQIFSYLCTSNLQFGSYTMLQWHLGMYAWDYTPTYRGFDSFFGYYTGAEGYVDHVNGIHASVKKCVMRDNSL